MTLPTPTTILNELEELPRLDYHIWIIAFLFFITGDVLSTQLVLTTGAGYEGNPLTRYIIHTYGLTVLLLAKTLVISFLLGTWVLGHYSVEITQTRQYSPSVRRVLSHIPFSPTQKTLLHLLPLSPAVAGIYLTLNNILVAHANTMLHTYIFQTLYLVG